MKIEIVDQPVPKHKYADVREALLKLPDGKSLRVPADTFRNYPPNSALRMERCGRHLRTRKLPDGLYLWLDPLSANGSMGEKP